jgi:hypothetical protein
MIYVSNISKMVDSLNLKFKELKPIIAKASREIASDLMFANKNRVYTQGESVEGARIGNYSTKPILIGESSFRTKSVAKKAFSLIKKEGKRASKIVKGASKWVTINKNGNNIHLAVLATGYKGIRGFDGDEIGFVNLKRTGKMFKDLQMMKSGNDWVIGFPANYNKSLSYSDMVSHFRDKYGKQIWGVSKSDEKQIDEVLKKYLS